MKKDVKTNSDSKVNKKSIKRNFKLDRSFFTKYSTIIFSMLLVVVFVVVLSASYAFFTTTVKGKEFVIYTGTLAVNYAKKTNVINVENLYPMTNTQGLNQTAHEFTVTNDGNINARYQVRLELDNSLKDMISTEYIKLAYSIDGSNYSEPVLLSDLNSSLVFLKDVKLAPTEANTIGIKLWIDIDAPNDIQGKTFKAKVVVDSIQDVEDEYVVDTVPIIYLNKDKNGNQDINLKVGQTYTELGVERVEDDKDVITSGQVTKTYEYYDGTNLSTVNSVDTSKTGIYYITYSVTDTNGNTGKSVRILTVNNTGTAPTITLNGNSTITLGEYDEYIELGASVANGNKVVIIGNVKTSTIGTYMVRYIVIDKNNNLNSVIRTVNVNETTTLYNKLFAYNSINQNSPTLSKTSEETNENGLYKSTDTNDGSPTYYFRGNVENYVDFAGFAWRVVRINEDGTIRLIMQDGINDNATYKFNSVNSSKENMYYSNSDTAKPTLEAWYKTNIIDKGYVDNIVTGNYFCEEAKVVYSSNYATNSGASMKVYTSYTPNFTCEKNEKDGNGKGYVPGSVGLITYDEVAHAGGYYNVANNSYYLYGTNTWTMSPAGFSGSSAIEWSVYSTGNVNGSYVNVTYRLRPVINLKADTVATGTGTSTNPYAVGQKLSDLILESNELIEAEPTLTTSSNNTSDASGLYMSTATNTGDPTYYFRGNVENNYVDFAGYTWRVVRINEDGTIRLIMQDGINDNTTYTFNSTVTSKDNMYYSNSDTAKPTLEAWYKTNIVGKGYADAIVIGNYFCEQAKVAYNASFASNSGASMSIYTNYTPEFKCENDTNGKGILNTSVGLLTYDEASYAGGYYGQNNGSYYLYNNTYFWTMSPAGSVNTYINDWCIGTAGHLNSCTVTDANSLRPVINLKADTVVTGLGTSSKPYKVIS